MRFRLHLTDAELIAMNEGSPAPPRKAQAEAHLQHCETCRRRAGEYARLLSLAAGHRSERSGLAHSRLPSDAFERALATMTDAPPDPAAPSRWRLQPRKVSPMTARSRSAEIQSRSHVGPRSQFRYLMEALTVAVILGSLAGLLFLRQKSPMNATLSAADIPANNSSALSFQGFIHEELGPAFKTGRSSASVPMGSVRVEIRQVRAVKAPAQPGPDLIPGPYYFIADGRLLSAGEAAQESRIYLLNVHKAGNTAGGTLLRHESPSAPINTGKPSTLPTGGVPFQAMLSATEEEVNRGRLDLTLSLWTAPSSSSTLLSTTPYKASDNHNVFEGNGYANNTIYKWLMRWAGLHGASSSSETGSQEEGRIKARLILKEYGTFQKELPVLQERSPWMLSSIQLEPESSARGKNDPRVYRVEFTRFDHMRGGNAGETENRTEESAETSPASSNTHTRVPRTPEEGAPLPPLRFTFIPASAFTGVHARFPTVELHPGP